MAMDTAGERYSAINVGSPWRGLNYIPSGTVDNPERQALAYLYAGISSVGAPIVSDTIPNISHTENTGTHSYDLGAYFTGATSYSIAPAVETGWTFNTTTGELVVDTDDVSVFGPYTVTGTNLAGSADSNAFTVTVVAAAVESATGGWLFLNDYEAELRRRRKRKKEREELEAETEQIQNELDRSIAQLLREQEAIDEKRDNLNRLGDLAKQNADLEAARQYSERVATAYARAITQGNFSALEALDRELQRARDEEEFLMLSLMLLAD